MKRLARCAVVVGILTALVLPVQAQTPAPADPGARVSESTVIHTQILTDLIAKVPEKAQGALEKALAASVKGHDAAIAALAKVGPTAPAPTATEISTSSVDPAKLQRARDRVALSFEKSIQTLQALAAKLPEPALGPTAAALEKVEAQRLVALDNLDLLIAGQRPESRSLDRPFLSERPAGPERPDRPQIPERPEVADRPEPPSRPEVPARPEPPASGN